LLARLDEIQIKVIVQVGDTVPSRATELTPLSAPVQGAVALSVTGTE